MKTLVLLDPRGIPHTVIEGDIKKLLRSGDMSVSYHSSESAFLAGAWKERGASLVVVAMGLRSSELLNSIGKKLQAIELKFLVAVKQQDYRTAVVALNAGAAGVLTVADIGLIMGPVGALPYTLDYRSLPSAYYKVTQKERSIIAFIAGGYSNKDIASELSLSEDRVKQQVRSICHKLGVSSRTALVAKAMRQGVIG